MRLHLVVCWRLPTLAPARQLLSQLAFCFLMLLVVTNFFCDFPPPPHFLNEVFFTFKKRASIARSACYLSFQCMCVCVEGVQVGRGDRSIVLTHTHYKKKRKNMLSTLQKDGQKRKIFHGKKVKTRKSLHTTKIKKPKPS